MGKLTGKVAFITGASRGIGAGITRAYAKHGAKLILADVSPDMDVLARELQSEGYDVFAVKADVTNPEDMKRAAQAGVDQFGTIDVLVNNAGVCRLGNFLEMSDKDRDFHIDVNIKGVWNTTKAVLPYMIEKKFGNIVIMSSVTGDMVADPGEHLSDLQNLWLLRWRRITSVSMQSARDMLEHLWR